MPPSWGHEGSENLDVRIILRDKRQPRRAVRDGVFRQDLFFRLNVIPVFFAGRSVKERRHPSPGNSYYLQRLCDAHLETVTGISSESLRHSGLPLARKVREMETWDRYALHLTDGRGKPIRPEQLPPNLLGKKDIS